MTDQETTIVPPAVSTMEQSSIAIALNERENTKLQAKILAEKTAKLSEAKTLFTEFENYVKKVKEYNINYEDKKNLLDLRSEIRNTLVILSECCDMSNIENNLAIVMTKVKKFQCLDAEEDIRADQHDQFVEQFQPKRAEINEKIPATRGQGYEETVRLLSISVANAQQEYNEQVEVANKSAASARKEIFNRGMEYDREVDELQTLIREKQKKRNDCFAMHDQIELV